jgi:hypothetical protein
MFILRLHSGATPSFAQYSSISAIKPFLILQKLTTWNDELLSVGKTLTAVMIKPADSSTRSISPAHCPGYSQLALMYSGTVNSSLLQCHRMTASS